MSEKTKGDEIVRDAEIKDRIERDLHDHEVFISFNGDSDARAFRDWLDMKGWDGFARWYDKNASEYQN